MPSSLPEPQDHRAVQQQGQPSCEVRRNVVAATGTAGENKKVWPYQVMAIPIRAFTVVEVDKESAERRQCSAGDLRLH
jgi:hypothetical protein